MSDIWVLLFVLFVLTQKEQNPHRNAGVLFGPFVLETKGHIS